MQTANAKVCIHCQQDCSNKPRLKDETGRYACKACVERLATKGQAPAKPAAAVEAKPKPAAPRSAPAPAALMDDAIDLSSLVAAERTAQGHVAEGLRCPSCKANLPAGTQLCTMCAWDFKLGRPRAAAKPVVVKAPQLKSRWGGKPESSPLINISIAGIGIVILGIVFFAAQSSPEMRNLYFVLAAMYSIAAFALSVMTPLSEDRPGYAICAVASLFLSPLWFVSVYYALFATERSSLKYWLLGQFLSGMGIVLLLQKLVNGDD